MDIFREIPVLVPLVSVCITEALKLIISVTKKGKLELKDFFATGGIPSGHSAFVSSLSMMILMIRGLNTLEFAISFVFAFLVIFDAIKLRGEAGKHAKALNKILGNHELNERLGHNLFEVLTGIFLGSGIAFLLLQ